MGKRVGRWVPLGVAVILGATSCMQTHRVAGTYSGPDTVFFRPVFCQIPPFANGATPAAPTATPSPACSSARSSDVASTPPSGDLASASVILPNFTGQTRFVLGPADLTATALASATPMKDPSTGANQIQLAFTQAGGAAFDAVARVRYPYYQQHPSDPPVQSLEAIVVDGVVVSAATIMAQSFNGSVLITGPYGGKTFTSQQIQQIESAITRAIH